MTQPKTISKRERDNLRELLTCAYWEPNSTYTQQDLERAAVKALPALLDQLEFYESRENFDGDDWLLKWAEWKEFKDGKA